MSSRPWYENNYKLPSPEVADIVSIEQELDNICDKCGLVLEIGYFPFCSGNQSDHIRNGRFGLDPLTPHIDEHILSGGKDEGYDLYGNKVTGTYVDSRGHRAQLMRENGIADTGGGLKRRGINTNKSRDLDKLSESIAKQAYLDWKQRG